MKTYQRLAAVFDAAVIDGLRPDNPATPIRRELHKRAGRRRRDNFPSMPYQWCPAAAMRHIPDLRSSPRLLPHLLRAKHGVAVTDNISAFTTPRDRPPTTAFEEDSLHREFPQWV